MDGILVLSPVFYGYGRQIAQKLEERFNNVFYEDDTPCSKIYSILNVFFPFFLKWAWHNYKKRVYRLVANKHVDVVFIIKGEFLPEDMIYHLKNILGVNIIQYQWDSILNNSNALMLEKYSSRSYTFDRGDSITYSNFVYLPLFYSWDETILKQELDNQDIEIDILFIGFWSSDRIMRYYQIEDFCQRNTLKLYSHIYIPFISYLKRLFTGERIPYKLVSFRILPRSRYLKLLQNTKVVFDVPNTNQIGATMRTIESISQKKKVITTNKHIENEDFYRKENFCQWPNEDKVLLNFLSNKFNDESFNHIHDVNSWLNVIFEDEE